MTCIVCGDQALFLCSLILHAKQNYYSLEALSIRARYIIDGGRKLRPSHTHINHHKLSFQQYELIAQNIRKKQLSLRGSKCCVVLASLLL